MIPVDGPIIDDQNPFYCPAVSARAFIDTLQSQLRSASALGFPDISDAHSVSSFAKRLQVSITEDDMSDLVRSPALPKALTAPSLHAPVLDDSSSSDQVPGLDRSVSPLTRLVEKSGSDVDRKSGFKRKRSSSMDAFSELLASPKHGRSFDEYNDKSFQLSAKAERLQFFPRNTVPIPVYSSSPRAYNAAKTSTMSALRRKVATLEHELYGQPVGTQTPRGLKSLISHLDLLFPGIRLKERLYALETVTHQRIADILAVDGHLSDRVLNILRTSEIECIDLTASIMDEDGLNLGAHELMRVFTRPNSFLFLKEINLSGAPLRDFDITNIHHLPRLARLWLSNTGIGNEAIYHLCALKRTLTELDIAFNHRIDDDVIPALLSLPKLRFLSLIETSVAMPGLRKLAVAFKEREDRSGNDPSYKVQVEIPYACEDYISKLSSKYMLNPLPPLIVDPKAVADLSAAALRRNLAAHETFNEEVVVGGSRKEMAERLRKILVDRSDDLVVKEMVREACDEDSEDVVSEGVC
ncbi:hypothetical protein A0H81_07389, partial [Grifola frondosa]